MGLDVVRPLQRDPAAQDAFLTELRAAAAEHTVLTGHIDNLATQLHRHRDDLEPHARPIMGLAAVAWQAALLLHNSPTDVAETFIYARTGPDATLELGTLDGPAATLGRIIDRARVD